ncbi:MAG TPA: sigma-70 family RNA polymerase sigma factor [Pirellulales bacterium]|jgi:RNA polymerase sigma-70 factor (ECF subfamily)|nr:sigma-70 family RNA polymerase sigma factor [Pirellulales bacterium]
MTDEPSSIDVLVARLKAGDNTALADLFSVYRGMLRRMIELRLDPRLAGRLSASDVLQEVYLDAAQRVRHFVARPEMPFVVWLRIVTGQRLVDLHRQHLGAQRRDARNEVSINQGGMLSASSMCLAEQLVGRMTSPSQAAARLEAIGKLETALEQLEPIDREVLALRHFEELSNRETAEILGIEPSAASKRYLRALERLKTISAKIPGLLDGA